MTVATKTQPNFTTQSAAAYKANIDAITAVHDRLAGAFAAHEMDIGSPAPDLAVRVDAGYVWDGVTLIDVAAQTVTGFTVPSAGQNRMDRVVIDNVTGAASRVAGTAVTGSPSATPPSIPAGYSPVCRVFITSADAVITNSMITDERTQPASTALPPGAMIDYAGNGAGSPNSPPVGFLMCDGRNVSRSTYAALFAAIGTTWGAGDGSTTFTIPDARRRVSVGVGGTATSTLGNAIGNTGGAETHTLSSAEMPSHTHTVGYNSGAFGGSQTVITGVTDGTLPDDVTKTSSSTGSGGSHNNMQPSYVVMKIIKT